MRIYNWDDVESISGVSKHRVRYAVSRGRLGDFTMINGAYVFSDEDITKIETYFSDKKPWQRNKDIEINNQKSEIQE